MRSSIRTVSAPAIWFGTLGSEHHCIHGLNVLNRQGLTQMSGALKFEDFF